MNTAQRQVLSAMVDVLKSAGVAGGRVYSSRTRAINSETPHAVVVRLIRSASTLASVIGGPTEWHTMLQVECYGRLVGGAPDEASDQVVLAVFDALARAPSLGGSAIDVSPMEGDTLEWDFDEMDMSLACIKAKFIVLHQTQGRTLNP